MPAGPFEVDLSTTGRHQIAEVGQRVNGLWITDMPNGAEITVDLGKNIDLPVGTGTMTFGGSPESDRTNGVWIKNETAIPGGIVRGGLSYE